ncbi:MAG TPA: AMP-binding protein [Trebonia sp.]
MDVSFGTIWEAIARELPDAVAITEPARDYTFAEFDDRASRLAAALAAAGVGPGDKVACYLYNGAAYLETVFAAFKLGAVPVNANYRYTEHELTALLADADAAALVFSGSLAANVADAASALSTLRLLVRVGPVARAGDGGTPPATNGAGVRSAPRAPGAPETPGATGSPDWLAAPVRDAPELADLYAVTAPRAPAPRPASDQLFMYTGGTTGKPKGVIWHQSQLFGSLGPGLFRRLGAAETPETVDELLAIVRAVRAEGRSPVALSAVPLMHATGLFNGMGTLTAGGRVVVTRPGGLNPRHVWETVALQRVRTLVVAGNAVCQPLVDELLTAEAAGRPYDLTSLDAVTSSGTVLSDRLKRALHERADVTISDALASSEGGPFAIAVTTSADDLPSRFFPAAGTQVLTASGAPVVPGSGEVGTLAFGGSIPSGYYKDAAKTSSTFRVVSGVRYTMPGDLATVEADGSIRFLGRGAGVINTGGEKVHPQEVEDVLLAYPGVTDASVVGVPDDTWGERLVAVVATANLTLTSDELRAAVRRRLAGYKVPRAVILLPALPRTPTGKLELARVRRIAAAATTAPDPAPAPGATVAPGATAAPDITAAAEVTSAPDATTARDVSG